MADPLKIYLSALCCVAASDDSEAEWALNVESGQVDAWEICKQNVIAAP